MKHTLTALLFLSLSQQSLAQPSEAELQQTLDAYSNRIIEIESEQGPFSPQLIEVLNSMTEVLEQLGDRTKLGEVLLRQIQIIRTSNGFKDLQLIPLYQDLISNDLALGHVDRVTGHLERLRFVLSSNNETDSTILLRSMERQVDWHLALIQHSNLGNRVDNFFKARALTEELLEVAEQHYGETDLELVPWLYRDAINQFHLVQFLNASNETSMRSIERLAREDGAGKLSRRSPFFSSSVIPVLEEDEVIGEYYLRVGLRSLNKILDIAKEANQDEMSAMALIYRGDYKRLIGIPSASRDYRDAIQGLLESGIEQESIDQFFLTPAFIPNYNLQLTFDSALKERKAEEASLRAQFPAYIGASDLVIGQFTAWHHAVPSTLMPIPKDPLIPAPTGYAEALFQLSINSQGTNYNRDAIFRQPDQSSTSIIASRSVDKIKFRPSFVNGRAKRIRDVYLSYRFVP